MDVWWRAAGPLLISSVLHRSMLPHVCLTQSAGRLHPHLPCAYCCVVQQKGEHYHIDDGQDAINNIYACGLIEEINIEPEQDMQDPSKINIKVVVEEVQPKSMEVSSK